MAYTHNQVLSVVFRHAANRHTHNNRHQDNGSRGTTNVDTGAVVKVW